MNGDAPMAGGLAAVPQLTPQQIRFERTDGSLVRAILATGTRIEPVDFYRAFPFSAPDLLVSVRDSEGHEIGMLAPLATFPAADTEIIHTELRRRYFAPRITAIRQLDERFGQSHWQVDTEAGPAAFTVRNEHANLRDLPDGTLLLVDIHGNRYLLAPRAELAPRIRRRLEAMF